MANAKISPATNPLQRIISWCCSNPWTLLLLIAFAAIIFWFSLNTIWIGDDIAYQYKIFSEYSPTQMVDKGLSPQPIDNVQDLIFSQYNHYFLVNGRIIAHCFVQYFNGIIGQSAFAFCNAIIYIIFSYLILKSAQIPFKSLKTWLTLIILIIIGLPTKMMPSTQIGYIWMGCIILIFINLFLSNKHFKPIYLIGIIIFAFIAGNAHEAYGFGICLAMAAYCIKHRFKMPISKWIFAIAFALGLLLLALSPATLNRASTTHISPLSSIINILLFSRVFYIMLIVIGYQILHRHKSIKDIYSCNAFFLNVIAGCILFNILVGIDNNRQLMGVEIFSIIVTMRLLKEHRLNSWWLLILGSMCALFLFFNTWLCYTLHHQFKEIVSQYETDPNSPIYYDVTDYRYPLSANYTAGFWQIGSNSSTFYNTKAFNKGKKPYIYPSFLQGKDSLHLGNQAIMSKNISNRSLIIQSKEHPATFKVNRSAFGILQLPPIIFDNFVSCAEMPYWRATVIFDSWPFIINENIEILQ